MVRHDVKSVKRPTAVARSCRRDRAGGRARRLPLAPRARYDPSGQRQVAQAKGGVMRAAAAGIWGAAAFAGLCGTGAAAQTYHGSGTVTGIVAPARQVVIDAGDIPGYMAAMEMAYQVDAASLLSGLKTGDRIEFDIDAATHAIVRIKVIGAQK
jgi:Cu/Ag efflux protein CusF